MQNDWIWSLQWIVTEMATCFLRPVWLKVVTSRSATGMFTRMQTHTVNQKYSIVMLLPQSRIYNTWGGWCIENTAQTIRTNTSLQSCHTALGHLEKVDKEIHPPKKRQWKPKKGWDLVLSHARKKPRALKKRKNTITTTGGTTKKIHWLAGCRKSGIRNGHGHNFPKMSKTFRFLHSFFHT